jgi:ribosomal protein S18 acetylase RimI-like enzyme
MLHVAGDNSSAISLYSSLGMTVAHHEEVFVGSVPAADAR